MKSQVMEENLKKQSDMCRLLQEAVINLCQKNYTASDVEIDGIICISFQNSYQQHVVKIHEKLKNENGADNDMNHTEYEDRNPNLVVCDLTENYNSSQTLDHVGRIYSKDSIFRRKPDSLLTGIKDSHRDNTVGVMNSNNVMSGRKFTGSTKSKRKNRTPSYIASVAKRRQDVFQDRDNYGNDDGERMQELLSTGEENSLEFKRTLFHEENMDDDNKFNPDFIVIKSEPIGEEKNSADSTEGETTFNDHSRNEDEENSVAMIQDGTDTMYLVKHEYSYQDEDKDCSGDDFKDDVKPCPDDITGQQDSYNVSYLEDSLSGNATENTSFDQVYHPIKHGNMQTGDYPNEENNFNNEPCPSTDQQEYPPFKSTPKSFPHLKLKLSKPSRMFSNKNRSDSQLTSKSTRYCVSPQGSRKLDSSPEVSSHYKAQEEEYDRRRIYFCRYCGKGFTMKCTQMRHEKTICEGGGEANYKCDICDKFFTRSDSRLRHMIKTHKINTMSFM